MKIFDQLLLSGFLFISLQIYEIFLEYPRDFEDFFLNYFEKYLHNFQFSYIDVFHVKNIYKLFCCFQIFVPILYAHVCVPLYKL